MEFPTTPLLDDFNRANGVLGAPWVASKFPSATLPSISSNALALSSTRRGFELSGFSEADVECYVTLATAPVAGTFFRLFVRQTLNGCYALRIDPLQTSLLQLVGVSEGQLASPGAIAWAAGDKAGIRVVGARLEGWRKPVGQPWKPISQTIMGATGLASLRISGPGTIGVAFDDISLDDIGGGACDPPPPYWGMLAA